jgi:hypothetical protein
MLHTYNPSIWEVEARGSDVGDHPGLHNKTLSQKKILIIGAGGVAQVAEQEQGPESKPQYHQKKNCLQIKKEQHSILLSSI